MSTAIVVASLAAGLFVLVTIGVTMQTLEKNRREKRLLENSLNSRARNFQYLLDGFPQGFLGRDLQVLVCKCLAEVYEKLLEISPKESSYQKQRTLNAERLSQFQEGSNINSEVPLSDLGQIKEVQKLLTSLHKFISQLHQGGRINEQEGKVYSQQIQRLMMQTTIDAYNQQIQAAIGADKQKLAIHHLHTVIDKLTRHNGSNLYTGKIAVFQEQLSGLERLVADSDAASAALRAEADKEWDALNKPDDSWKKKALYD